MNAGQNGQGGGNGGNFGGAGGLNGITTTAIQQASSTIAAGFHTTTSTSHSPTATATISTTSTKSSGVSKAVIGGIVGGLAFLLILSLLAVFLLQRRKKRQLAEKNGTVEPVTYGGLNSSFGGVPFSNSSQQDSLIQHQPYIANGIGSPQGNRGSEDQFLPPTYAESMTISSPSSHGRLTNAYTNTPPSDHSVSPISTHQQSSYPYSSTPNTAVSPVSRQATGFSSQPHPSAAALEPQFSGFNEHANISPQVTGSTNTPSHIMSQYTGGSTTWTDLSVMEPLDEVAYPPPLRRHDTADTMGFPETIIPLDQVTEPVQIVSPTPRPLRVRRATLERVVQQGLADQPRAELPGSNGRLLAPRVADDARRESDVLGEQNPVKIGPPQVQNNMHRHASTRTSDSVNSIGMELVSDGELDRLGVGNGSFGR